MLKRLRKEFLEMNHMTKPEVARFHRQRTSTVKEAMADLARSEVCFLLWFFKLPKPTIMGEITHCID